MRLLIVTSGYPSYVEDFYRKHPGLDEKPFSDQKDLYDYDHFAWGNALKDSMEQIGYEVLEIDLAMAPMLRAWARENLVASRTYSSVEIVLERTKKFQPEIIMFDCSNHKLLKDIRKCADSIRMIFGWTGSALGLGEVWSEMDLVLSCAPESVDELRRLGYKAEHLNHAFDPRVNSRLADKEPVIPISFIGTIVRRDSFHVEREKILLNLSERLPLCIYSPTTSASLKDYVKVTICGGVYVLANLFKGIHVLNSIKANSGFFEKWLRIASIPRLPVNRKLARISKPAIYGLSYYQVIKNSSVSLNIHADSSPRFASNIRLFEATGVGSCLLTDWRANLPQLFEIDKEVVTYKCADECAEKARWLLDHPMERQQIAKCGQNRVLRDYTFSSRALEMDAILKRYLRNTKQ